MAASDIPRDDEALDWADSLMSRHRQASPPPVTPVAPATTPADELPVLTDVVSLGPPTARRAPDSAPADEPVATPADIDALEQEVYRRLVDRFDREVGGIIERRVMPELAGSLDYALSQIAAELKGSLRQLVRETIEETLQKQVRNRRLPLGDAPD
jgi:hypothetical protein